MALIGPRTSKVITEYARPGACAPRAQSLAWNCYSAVGSFAACIWSARDAPLHPVEALFPDGSKLLTVHQPIK